MSWRTFVIPRSTVSHVDQEYLMKDIYCPLWRAQWPAIRSLMIVTRIVCGDEKITMAHIPSTFNAGSTKQISSRSGQFEDVFFSWEKTTNARLHQETKHRTIFWLDRFWVSRRHHENMDFTCKYGTVMMVWSGVCSRAMSWILGSIYAHHWPVIAF